MLDVGCHLPGLDVNDTALANADARSHPTVSFELFPPRSDTAALALGRTIDRLAAVDPTFFSVTFGANGSTRDRSLTVLTYILRNTSVRPMAHLTCVGSTHADASALVREFLDAGIHDFLALRGDPPLDAAPDAPDAFGSAAELVQLIYRVEQERSPYTQQRLDWFPDAARLTARPTVATVAVAAFPSGHPRQRSRWQDVDALLAKQAAGATLAITQLFWRADDYLEYVERARAAGVTIPILPGIAPVTRAAQLRRIAELSGHAAPAELVAAMEAGGDDEAAGIGIDFTARLARAVLDGGAPSTHWFTFNRHDAVLRVLDALDHPIPAPTGADR